VAGRKKFLAWCVVHGRKEYQALKDLEVFWNQVSMPADIPETEWSGGISQLLFLAVAERPDLQKAFNLDTAAGRQGFSHWLGHHAPRETFLDLLQAPNPPAWGAGRLEGKEKTQAPFGVNLIGYAFGELGIGEDVRMAAQTLDAVGMPFTVIDFPPGDDIRQNDRGVAKWVTDRAVYSIDVVCLTALEHLRLYAEKGADLFRGRYTIGYWPWELQTWPENWRHCFNLVDEVWASSRHTYRAVRAATPLPVTWMPMAVALPEGLDVSAPKFRERFGLPEDRYLFVFSFDGTSYIHRKNPGAVVAAFTRAFDAADRGVGLVVKCMRPDQKNPVWQEITASAAADDRILVLDAMLSKTDVMELYRACDCFVSLHRAEGFGRGIAEALLLGLDVIATGHGGNVDFCRKAGARLVAHKDIPLKPGDYVEGAGKHWAEPDIEDAARAMQTARTNAAASLTGSPKPPDPALLTSLFSFESIGTRYRKRLRRIVASSFSNSKVSGE
jgi:glycosyltransferase involved in cell wall biosynthesis